MTSNIVEKTIWRVIDSHWRCVYHARLTETSVLPQPAFTACLCEYLAHYFFDIPDSITFCLAQNEYYELKYRVYGGQIICYIKNRV